MQVRFLCYYLQIDGGRRLFGLEDYVAARTIQAIDVLEVGISQPGTDPSAAKDINHDDLMLSRLLYHGKFSKMP